MRIMEWKVIGDPSHGVWQSQKFPLGAEVYYTTDIWVMEIERQLARAFPII